MRTLDNRAGVMLALAAAEHLVAVTGTVPDSVQVEQSSHFPPRTLGVDLHFYRAPLAVAGFAAAMGATVTEVTAEFGGEWFTETIAAGVLDGVPYRAWTRIPVHMPTVQHLSAKQVA